MAPRAPVKNIRVVVFKDGPYIVTSNVRLSRQTTGTDAEGGSETWLAGKTFAAQGMYMLCRCGQSKNKPFCDGTHTAIKFRE